MCGATVINFKDQAGQVSTSPVQLDGLVGRHVVYTASSGAGFSMRHGLADNGFWDGERGFACTKGSVALIFTFNDGPVAAAGGLMNANCGGGSAGGTGDLVIEALETSSSSVLDSGAINQ